MADELDISKSLEQSLKDSKKIQGDTNLELNKTINLLSKINDLRENSIAKVKSLNRETINTREIQKELTKVKEKEQLALAKLSKLENDLADNQKQNAKDYLSAISAREKKEEAIQRAKLKGNTRLANFLGTQLNQIDQLIGAHERDLTVEERKYAAAVKSNDIAKEAIGVLQEELVLEKDINKSIGFSGKAMGFFAEKLGIGKEYYADMVEKARDLNEQGKKFTFFDKLGGLAKAAGGGALEALTDPLTLIPILGGAIAGLAKGLKSAFDYIVGIQDKTIKFARAMNMSTEQARQLKMQYADINIANGDLFVNTEKLVQAQSEMVGLLGITNQLSTENLATNIKLKDIAGIEADTIASITESSIINGKTNESIVKSVFAQVKGLKQATGIQFENKQILKEASSLGGVLGLQFSKYPAQLTKSLLTVKAMGMELKQLDAMADSFLDFESSISKEFEAQLLTGKEINLAKARELFLNNDLAGAAAEINKQVGSTADFLKMNRIQQDAFAGAMGMSRDQMGDMLKKQEMLSKLGAKDTDNSREQLRLGLAKYKNQKALSEAIGEENYQNLINASLQEKIGAFMEKIKQSISDFVEKSGIIGKIEGMMNFLSQPQNIRTVLMTVRDVFATIVDVVASVASGIISAMDFFGVISEQKSAELKGFLDGAGDRVRSMGGNLSMTAAKEQAGPATISSTGASTASQSTLMGSPNQTIILQVDGEPVAKVTKKSFPKMSNQDNNQTGKMGK
tara:strand:- start:5015 stop:7240 length:2226 start_codon:yes stop_codon:yes gene_type:complete